MVVLNISRVKIPLLNKWFWKKNQKNLLIPILIIVVVTAVILIGALAINIILIAPSPGAIAITDLTTDRSGNLFVYIQNVGTTRVHFNTSKCVYVNEKLQNCSIIQNDVLAVGQVTKIAVAYGVKANNSIIVKVLTSTGASAESTKSISQPTEEELQITIASNPSGPAFVEIDGQMVVTPIIKAWLPGSTHKIEAYTQTSGDNGMRFQWVRWSDNGFQAHNFVVPDSSQKITAIFNTQFQVKFSADSAQGSTNPAGTSWYDSATVLPILAIANSDYSFSSWIKTGSIFISQPSYPTASATINGPGTVTANFSPNQSPNNSPQPTPSATPSPNPTPPPSTNSVSIIISSDPIGSNLVKVDDKIQATPFTVSWTVGSTHSLEAISNVKNGNSIQYVWTSWSNGASQTQTYVVPSSNAAITAYYRTQYLFTLKTNGLPAPYLTRLTIGVQQVGQANDATPFSEWLDASSNTGIVGVDATVYGPGGTRYVFAIWSTDGLTTNPKAFNNNDFAVDFNCNIQDSV